MRLARLCPEFFGLLSRILTLFPIWVTVICFASPYNALPLWCCGVLLLCGLLPALIGRFTKIGQKHGIRVIFACICAAGSILATRFCIGNVAAVLLSAVTAIFGSLSSQKESDTLFDKAMFVGFLALETVSLILLAVVEIAISMPLAVALTTYQSVVFLLLCNRYHLQRLVNRRCDGGMPVPLEILRSNRRLVIGIMLGCAIVFLLGKPVIALLQLLLDGGIALLGLLLKGIVTLIRVMGGSALAAPTEGTENPAPAPMPDGSSNSWWSLLYLLLIPVVLLIWRVLLRDVWLDLLESLRQRMGRVQSRSQDTQTSTQREYEDIETLCDAEDAIDRTALRNWKKACRKWKKMPDSEQKLQEGYRLLLCAPAWGEAQPLPPDTPLEILQKGEQYLPSAIHEEFGQLTEDYQQVRYGGYVMLPRTLAEMETLLTTFSHKPQTHP